MIKNQFKMKAEVWLYPGENASWHFVTLPKKQAQEIRKNFAMNARGWGSLPVSVTIGKTTWKTSLFPEKKQESYLLPLKASVRSAEGIHKGDTISFTLTLDH